MTHNKLCVLLLASPLLVAAQEVRERAPAERTLTVGVTTGLADTLQLVLGGTFGVGPNWQDKLSASLNHALRNGDSLTVFGWSATDLPSMTPNWQAGLLYKVPLLRRKQHSWSVTGGLQRWVLPMVRTGAKDWLL